MKDFTGSDVRLLRKEAKVTQKEMAELLGVAEITLRKWEKLGDQKIKKIYSDKLNEVLEKGVELSSLYGASGLSGEVTGGLLALTGSPFLLFSGGILGLYWSYKKIKRKNEVS